MDWKSIIELRNKLKKLLVKTDREEFIQDALKQGSKVIEEKESKEDVKSFTNKTPSGNLSSFFKNDPYGSLWIKDTCSIRDMVYELRHRPRDAYLADKCYTGSHCTCLNCRKLREDLLRDLEYLNCPNKE